MGLGAISCFGVGICCGVIVGGDGWVVWGDWVVWEDYGDYGD